MLKPVSLERYGNMSTKSRRLCVLLGFVVLAALAGCPSPETQDLDAFIRQEMHRTHIPGLAALTFNKDGVLWSHGYGSANIKDDRSVSVDTLFQLASISKLVTSTAVMQLVEGGKVDLDADIDEYLPFSVRNPYYADTPITVRMLLTHTASLLDNDSEYEDLYEWGADSPISLGELLEGFYTPSGRWYHQSKCFLNKAPGTFWSYSNLGFAMLGYLVEAVTGEPFDQYCDEHVFAPLGMTESRWFLRQLDPAHIAMPYRDASLLGIELYCPYGQYGYPDYPSGQLRTSVTQFARFFRAFMNQGTLDGATILRTETVEQMFTIQNAALAAHQGLGWILLTLDDGSLIRGHSGGEHGVHTSAWYSPASGTGVLLFTNADPNDLLQCRVKERIAALDAIQTRLFKESQGPAAK